MRTLILILTFLLTPGAALARAPADPVAAINVALDGLHDAASKADGPRYFALYTDDAIYIGTDAAERWTLSQFQAYANPYFAKGQGWTYLPRERHVVIAPLPCRCVAWFDELLDSKSYGTSRGTGMMVLTNGVWKVSQYALTFPIPNDLAKHMTDEIKRFEAGEKVH
ncbi:MAG: nuclear transport factor 2 family protein [Caulobacter sp.]|nr:nuclear transport factor 2 family protein [Caulobacter sp.]